MLLHCVKIVQIRSFSRTTCLFNNISNQFWINTFVYYRMYNLIFFFCQYLIGCFRCFRMCFENHLKCFVYSGNIPPLFELSNSFNTFTFPSSINRAAFLSELWFFSLYLNNSSWIILPLINIFSFCPSFHC